MRNILYLANCGTSERHISFELFLSVRKFHHGISKNNVTENSRGSAVFRKKLQLRWHFVEKVRKNIRDFFWLAPSARAEQLETRGTKRRTKKPREDALLSSDQKSGIRN